LSVPIRERERYDLVGRWLAAAHKAVRAEVDARLVEAGGSLSTWIVLRAARSDAPLSQRELADAVGIEGPTLVRHLDRLVQDGLVERRREPEDRRIARIHVTPAGEALLERLTDVAEANEADIAELLPPDDFAALRRSLRTLHEHYRALGEVRRAGIGGQPE
jgi:MarR family transcriptional regulator, transcriptional regulator for hemolysin